VFLRSLPDHPLLDRVVRGRAWIPLLGVMLVGIVAMQVELLKLNAAAGRSIELISSLQSRNDVLTARVVAASDPGRIERLASHMGMTMPGPESVTFLRARSVSVRRALAGIHMPDLAAFQAALQVSNVAVTPIPSPPTAQTSGSQGASTSTGTGATSTAGNTAATTTTVTAAETTPTGAQPTSASTPHTASTAQPTSASTPPTAPTAQPTTTAAPPSTVP
jgi:hypothetical protein